MFIKRLLVIFLLLFSTGCESGHTTYEECIADIGNTSTQLEYAECYDTYKSDLDIDCAEEIDIGSLDYSSEYSEINHIQKACLDFKLEGEYYVVLYEEYSPTYSDWKELLISFSTEENKDKEVYFLNLSSSMESNDIFHLVKEYYRLVEGNNEELYIPFIVHVKDHEIIKVVDSTEFSIFLNQD